jgi:hypothetical protein
LSDINDNPPTFDKSLKSINRIHSLILCFPYAEEFTGGLTTEADFGSEVVRVTATDPDIELNAQLRYYIRKPVQSTLSTRTGQEEQIGANPFVIDRDTGIISLNFDPQRDMKGYFDMEVNFLLRVILK